MSVIAKSCLTEDEYLQGELLAKNKHQYIDGDVYAMAGASEKHNIISGNLFAELYIQLKGQPCKPYIADMKVKAESSFFYPDVMVVCDDHIDDTEYVKNSPKIIVEVLSRTTRIFDHSIKQTKYLAIDSLEYYVLVEQGFCEIQVLSRSAGFIPKYYYLGDEIYFPLISDGVTISVNDIYDRIDNDDKKEYLASLLLGVE